MKQIAILGSTGSIGTQTLDIVRENSDIHVCALSAGKNVELMEKQIREFSPELVSMSTPEAAEDLRNRVRDINVKIVSGMEGLIEVATIEKSEILVTGIVGMIGIRPTIEAIKCGKKIALANKETLVTAGHIIMPLLKEYNTDILPVDSEHSAIFQSLQGSPRSRLSKIILTASGGPFRGKNKADLASMRAKDALKHPNWSMGQKVTIDSASLVNKGLEVMEAHWLFDVAIDDIQVLIHPQSILHSAVEYVDGAVIGQMGAPDMKLPIEYALFYPDRRPLSCGKKMNFYDIPSLTFERPDMDTFEGLALALQAGKRGGSLPTVFNAANELAVKLFLEDRISFLQIYDLIRSSMEHHKVIDMPGVDDILAAEAETYEYIKALL
ncbi:MAG: 1-deoxy-D-xylulose-5-phosphate reductoisomerase [Lachnospiraceae bacterium]|nr:1-deoxy-D-xylulose-5-phosphate reductoisomerase [Candidatus Merdinaster equi]